MKAHIGDYVKVTGTGNKAIDSRKGTITGLYPRNALPIAVTLEGDKHETDFRETELIKTKSKKQFINYWRC